MKNLMIILIAVFCLAGCVATATISEDWRTMKVKGWGPLNANWEKDGEKRNLSRGKPLPIPDQVLLR